MQIAVFFVSPLVFSFMLGDLRLLEYYMKLLIKLCQISEFQNFTSSSNRLSSSSSSSGGGGGSSSSSK